MSELLTAHRTEIGAFLTRATRRLGVIAMLEGATGGIVVATVLLAFGWPGRTSPFTPIGVGLIAALFGAFARVRLLSQDPWRIAAQVEARAPRVRNLLFTAVEQAIDATAPSSGYITELIAARAAACVRELDAAALFPVGRRAYALPIAAALWVGAIALATRGDVLGRITSVEPVIDGMDVVITPPVYTGRPVVTERNPDRIRAIEGSRVEMRVRSNAGVVQFAHGEWHVNAAVARDGAVASITVTGDGFVSMIPTTDTLGDAASRSAAPRLLGISVERDAPPTVRIPAPGKDMLVADGKRAIDIAIEAGDDIGLASLTLRFTKVSGSGERFTFAEHALPVNISRVSATAWTARTRWSLDSLALEAGDMVVYRAVATDTRPGALPVESDAFIVEIVAPGGDAEAGYSMDPEDERTAISQQMVVLKTQRLLARKSGTPTEQYLGGSQEIAAEQRRVRAEFVFLMGGEMSDGGAAAGDTASMTDIDETEEAAAEEDLAAGRQLNQGRIFLTRAIRAMSLAARSLNEADLSTALVHEREAVKNLELAFSKNRILLRAFSQREALDTTRRLSGDLSDLSRSERAVVRPDVGERERALRNLGHALGSVLRSTETHEMRARGATEFAARALRINPSDTTLQRVASDLNESAAAWRRGQSDRAVAAAARALQSIVAQLAVGQAAVSGAATTLDARATRGALTDLMRGRRP